MTALDAKLQLKAGQTIAVIGSGPALDLAAPTASSDAADAVLSFAKDSTELRSRLDVLAAVAGRGGLAWVAYPKARQLGTDLNRDVIRGARAVRRARSSPPDLPRRRMVSLATEVRHYEPGVKETPRSTSPNPADLIVAKLSPADAAGVVADSLSAMETSLFGSAP